MAQGNSNKIGQRAFISQWLFQQLLATAITAVIFYGGYYHCPSLPHPATNDHTSKLAYTLRCCFPPALTIVWAVTVVIASRGSRKVANPLAGKESRVQVEKNILTNTLEQFVIFFALSLVLATYLTGPQTRLVALYAMAFTVGRILFNIGYRMHWAYRILGIAVNGQSSLVCTAIIVYWIASQGFFGGIDVAVGSFSPASEKVEL